MFAYKPYRFCVHNLDGSVLWEQLVSDAELVSEQTLYICRQQAIAAAPRISALVRTLGGGEILIQGLVTSTERRRRLWFTKPKIAVDLTLMFAPHYAGACALSVAMKPGETADTTLRRFCSWHYLLLLKVLP